MPGKNEARFEYIDILRGVAIFAVFLYHIFWDRFSAVPDTFDKGFLYLQSYTTDFLILYPFSFGWLGVTLFFILSGYSIFYSYLTSTGFQIKPMTFRMICSFYIRRVFRILPAYFCCLMLIWIITHKEGKQMVYHFLLIHNFNRDTFFTLNPSFWSIAVEWQYYLVFPFLIYSIVRFGLEKILITTVAISLFAIFYLVLNHIPFHDKFLYYNGLILWYQWLVGAYLAKRQYIDHKEIVIPNWSILLLMLFYVVMTWVEATYVYATYVAVFAMFLMVHEFSKGRLVVWSPLASFFKFLGKISFSFYLLHQPLLRIFYTYWNSYGFDNLWGLCMGIPIIFVFIALCSYGLYSLVEKPFQNLGKKLSLYQRHG